MSAWFLDSVHFVVIIQLIESFGNQYTFPFYIFCILENLIYAITACAIIRMHTCTHTHTHTHTHATHQYIHTAKISYMKVQYISY